MLKICAKFLAVGTLSYLLCSCGPPGGTYQVKTTEGSEINVRSVCQAAYPAQHGIEQYPGSTLAVNASSNSGGTASTMATLSTKDAPAQVAEFYKSKLESSGWTIESNINM